MYKPSSSRRPKSVGIPFVTLGLYMRQVACNCLLLISSYADDETAQGNKEDALLSETPVVFESTTTEMVVDSSGAVIAAETTIEAAVIEDDGAVYTVAAEGTSAAPTGQVAVS
jgi:hypothetical protein